MPLFITAKISIHGRASNQNPVMPPSKFSNKCTPTDSEISGSCRLIGEAPKSSHITFVL